MSPTTPRSAVDDILVKFDKGAGTNMYLRACRTPDRKGVVGAWSLYEDVNKLLPSEKGWDPPVSPSPPLFDIVPIEPKGHGLIATRNVKKGELIIRERPILMAPRVVFVENDRFPWLPFDKLMLQLVYWLEQSDREKLLQLHNCKSPDECGPLAGIVRTNGVPARFPQSRICSDYVCVCLNISYANHSCDPNAQQIFDPKTFTQKLHATRDIAEQEEITIGYVTIIAPRAERQEQLKTKYCFTCACTLCSIPEEYVQRNDKLRQHIKTTLHRIADDYFLNQLMECSSEDRQQLAERQIRSMELILLSMKVEDVHEGRFAIVGHLAVTYSLTADLQNFRKWAGECLRILEEEKDVMSNWEDTYAEWQRWNRNPTTMPTWGVLR